jgi:5'-nucleotidase / UDP-sugar diphosphatase
LKAQSDIIVLVGHLNEDDEKDVRARLPEVDVVIGGHIHAPMKEPIVTGTQWMGRLAAYGVEVGRLDMQVDPARKQVVSTKWTRIPVNAKSITPAADMAAEVARWEAKVTATMDVKIGEAKRTITKAELKGVIEQALCEMTGADFAFMGRGGVRDEIPKGAILVRNLWNVFPFDNKVVLGKFRGSELPPTITQGKTVDPKKIYLVATNEFSAANQSSPREINATGLNFPEVRQMQRDLLIDWVKKKKILE